MNFQQYQYMINYRTARNKPPLDLHSVIKKEYLNPEDKKQPRDINRQTITLDPCYGLGSFEKCPEIEGHTLCRTVEQYHDNGCPMIYGCGVMVNGECVRLADWKLTEEGKNWQNNTSSSSSSNKCADFPFATSSCPAIDNVSMCSVITKYYDNGCPMVYGCGVMVCDKCVPLQEWMEQHPVPDHSELPPCFSDLQLLVGQSFGRAEIKNEVVFNNNSGPIPIKFQIWQSFSIVHNSVHPEEIGFSVSDSVNLWHTGELVSIQFIANGVTRVIRGVVKNVNSHYNYLTLICPPVDLCVGLPVATASCPNIDGISWCSVVDRYHPNGCPAVYGCGIVTDGGCVPFQIWLETHPTIIDSHPPTPIPL